jgi:hypothetical protein
MVSLLPTLVILLGRRLDAKAELFTNPADPRLIRITNDTGDVLDISANKDSQGRVASVANAVLSLGDGDSILIRFTSGRPRRIVVPGKRVIHVEWSTDRDGKYVIESPDGSQSSPTHFQL